MGPEMLDRADRLNTSFINLQSAATGAAWSVGGLLAPSLEKASDAMAHWLELVGRSPERLGVDEDLERHPGAIGRERP